MVGRADFNPRSPHGERQACADAWRELVDFNPRSPHGERPVQRHMIMALGKISIHAPRTGSDVLRWTPCPATAYFNPRSPHGERRGRRRGVLPALRRISIHAPRTGSDQPYTSSARQASADFNPRSPHGERPAPLCDGVAVGGISIHAPRTGSDECNNPRSAPGKLFQSTLPARGATVAAVVDALPVLRFQSTLPARGATVSLLSQ